MLRDAKLCVMASTAKMGVMAVLLGSVVLTGLGCGGDGTADEASATAASPLRADQLTGTLKCKLAGATGRELLIFVNQKTFRGVQLATMLGLTPEGDFHPSYGSTAFTQRSDGSFSATFENTLAVDWSEVPAATCFSAAGGSYTFTNLTPDATGLTYRGSFRLPVKYKLRPGTESTCQTPGDVFVEDVAVTCSVVSSSTPFGNVIKKSP